MSKRLPRVEFFKGADKLWRWRMVAANGRKLCTPGESFSSRTKAKYNFDCVYEVMNGNWTTSAGE